METKCYEIEALEDFLKEHGLRIWSDHRSGEGWVNIHCESCQEIHEIVLEGYGG
jgi:hypothetical protein